MGFGWEDQLRVPRGNGRFSGRWVDMPWRTASNLIQALFDIDTSRGLYLPSGKQASAENEHLRRAIGDALTAAASAEGRSRNIDFDASDAEVGESAKKVTSSLKEAYDVVHSSGSKLVVLDKAAGAEVKGEAKSAYLAEYADALLDAHQNADLFSSTDWSDLSPDDRSVAEGAALDDHFPIDDEGGDSNLGERAAKKAAWEIVEAVRDDDENDDEGDGEGDGDPVREPIPELGAPGDSAEPQDDEGVASAQLVLDALDAVADGSAPTGSPELFRPDLADALRNDWAKGMLGTVQVGDDAVNLVAPDGSIVATVALDGTLSRGPGYDAWVDGAQSRYPGHRLWQSSDSVIRDIIGTSPSEAALNLKESTMSTQTPLAERVSSLDAGGGPTEAATRPKAGLSLLASAAPMNPPSEWFADPKLAAPSGLIVTPEGRVYGHVASWGVCHIAHTRGCVTAPHSRTNYAYFHTGSILTREGSQIPVGRITLDTTHAGPKLNALSAAQHYENTGAAVADVVCGEDQWGIWIAGAVRPSVSEEQIRALRAAPLSGDWREVAGNLELVAALSVNVPGFPIPRPTGLVASGTLRSLVASGMVAPASPRTRLEALAMRGHTPTSDEDIAYLRGLAARAAAVVAEAETLARAAAVSDLDELTSDEMEALDAGEVVELAEGGCGCEAEFTASDLDEGVLALANARKLAKMAARVHALRADAPSMVSDPEAMVAYGCNCRNKTRPLGPGSRATTTSVTTAKPKQTYSFTPPSGDVVKGSLLEVRAAQKRAGGGSITPL